MNRVELDPSAWLEHPALPRETHARLVNEGIIIAAPDAGGRLNPMTIGWGVFGTIWGRPIFQVLVRPSRYTYECIENTGDYTVNVLPPDLAHVANTCGTQSGRDIDKMSACELTPLPSQHITSAGIAEANIVFECRVVHFNDVQGPTFPSDIASNYYPEGDYHRIYFGQILNLSVERAFFERT